jgi:aryl-alcohol dehydrogenase-like predicted oxidoreductase
MEVTMEYRTLGRTGVKVSPICLGTANFADPTPEDEAIRIINRALDAGINLIDSGDSYANGESERIIGRALADNGQRQRVILTTKVHYPMGPGPNDRGNSRLHLIKACEDSLRRLRTDYIDLYQIHRPAFDMSVDETLGALTDLVRQGKVRYIGCSTHPAWKVMEALMVSQMNGYARYVSEQPPYNLLDRRIENELVPLCQAHGLGIFPWSPMAMGILAGRYSNDEDYPADSRAVLRGGIYAERVTRRGIEVGTQFVNLAREYGIPPAQLAMLWVKDQPGITAPLAGPRTVEQLEHLLPVMDMELDESIRAACDELVPPGSAVANFHNTSNWMKMRVL